MLDSLLNRAGITKAELARRMGITANAISKWRGHPPQYAQTYLLLLIESNYYREQAERNVREGIFK